jgi:DNA polymerase I-like protein with 3'-5' exonuclease and polymerase domains
MIYFVTNQTALATDSYKIISVEESLQLLKGCKVLQADSETTGLDPHINKLLCFQLGNKEKDFQIVIDCTCIDIALYKDILENTSLIFHNGKFDIQFLYNYSIIPKKVYDTMIIEQLLYLGYPHIEMSVSEYEEGEHHFPYIEYYGKYGELKRKLSFALNAVAKKRLNIDIDKSIRGDIIWKGLTEDVLQYAASDVKWLEDIIDSQTKDLLKYNMLRGAKLECDTVPVMAYLEWCGIKLDEEKWKAKMAKDKANLDSRKKALDDWLINICNTDNLQIEQDRSIITIGYTPYNDEEYKKYLEDKKVLESFGYTLINKDLIKSEMGSNSYTYKSPYKITDIINLKKEYIHIDNQGDLFSGFFLEPKVTINWDSSKQVVQVAKALGFNTIIQDKKTGEDKDSVLEKQLASQKGINDEFLKLYFNYKESSKLVTTYGQGHLNMIHPNTGRCHTVYHQLGAASGRMSCGSNKPNHELAALKRLDPKNCTFCNFQQLPADEDTRGAFVSEEGNLLISSDFSALESRLGADIYNEPSMIDEYINGSGDMHSLMAITFYSDQMEQGITTKEVKKKYPHLRKAAKSPEFLIQFGGSAFGLAKQLGISEQEAQSYVDKYYNMFKGIADFKSKGSKFVREYGYVEMCKYTGHKMFWWDHKKWLKRQSSFTQEFWEDYRINHKNTGDYVAMEVKEHFQAVSKWDRMALNGPTQGTGCIILKDSMITLFKWIIDNNYFNKVKIVAAVHDELVVEFPENINNFKEILENIMLKSAAKYCKSLPIPAEGSVGTFWIH